MKTLVIFSDSEDLLPVFATINDDWSRFDKVLINSTQSNKKLQEELTDLIWERESGERKIKWLDEFPYDFKHDKVIRIGFLC